MKIKKNNLIKEIKNSKYAQSVIFSYLDFMTLLSVISKLSKTTRKNVKNSGYTQ